MKYAILLLGILFVFGCKVRKQIKTDIILDKNKHYYYHAIYVDKVGDTITNDTIILKSLDRAWLGQFRSQEAISFQYLTDTVGYRKYIDPEPFFKKKNEKYVSKKNKLRIKKNEITGALSDSSQFFMHPPRANQFRMLSYAGYPSIQYKMLDTIQTVYKRQLKIYGLGIFNQKYFVSPIRVKEIPFKIIDKEIELWEINCLSSLISDSDCDTSKYNSNFKAVFCKEYGFIKLIYQFQNGIKIELELVKITSL